MRKDLRIVMTGASGVLGTGFRKMFPATEFVSFAGDVADFDEVHSFLAAAGKYDALFHFAAVVPKQVVDSNPLLAFRVNSIGTLNVLEASRKVAASAGEPWIFYASTSHVYSPSDEPLKEESQLKPYTFYGLSKLQGEQFCEAFAKNYGLPISVGRLFSFSDVQQTEDYFIPAMFRRIRDAKPGASLEIPGLTSTRDFLRVPQICQAIQTLMEGRVEGVVNIGTGTGIPLLRIVRKIAQLLKRDDLLITAKQDPPAQLVADTEKLKSFGISLESEIDLLLSEFARN